MSEQIEAPVGAQEGTPEGNPVEASLRPEEQEALKVAREGLPVKDPHAKPDGKPQRPEGVPEKFWDAEKGEVRVDAMAQSYAELESKLSAPKEEEAAEEEGDDVEVKNGKISKKEGEEASEVEEEDNPLSGLITTAATEFGTDGKFTEETAEALTKAGIPPEVQNIYLAGLSALQEQQSQAVFGYVGGEENYNAMAKWAGQHLTDAQLDAFNSALDNPDLAENAVAGLYARYQKAHPSEGRKVSPQNGTTDSGDIFASRKEMTDAMADPRYRTDAKYQREVMDKLRRTRATGTSFNR